MPATVLAPGVLLEARYRLGDVVGVGGMATVYRARDEVLARDVAVKVFPPAGTVEEQGRQRAEVAVLARLDHPGLVTLLDAGATDVGVGPQTYIVMELVPGPTLADVLAHGPLGVRQAAGIGAQLASALVAVHRDGVIHRDVKPANVLLADGGWDRAGVPAVKLADFGIARLVDAARLTVTGTTLGTATYLSPEQALGGHVGPPADVYALGIVLLECVTGRRAFTGTVAEVAAARLTTDPDVPAALGREWGDLLRSMTRRAPEERITTAEAAERLTGLTARHEPTVALVAPAPGSGPGGRVGSSDRRGRWPVLVGAALALGLAGGVGAAALQRGDAPREVTVAPPAVEGPLGEALHELVTSVQP